MPKAPTAAFDVPETPWDLVADQRRVMRKLWNRDYNLDEPVLKLGWGSPVFNASGSGLLGCSLPDAPDAKRRVEDAEVDVRYQLEVVRHEIERLECSREVGIPLANLPAFDLIHFGTGPLATAFGARFILREGAQPAFEPAVHTPAEVMRLGKPNLLRDGILPRIIERIQYYNDATRGKVILTPCDTAGPWSIATSIWHYEDMLEAIFTAPDAVHHLLGMVTDCMIEWADIQEAYIGRWGRTHSSFSWPFLARGTGIGDDTLVAVSPALWEEFFLPYNNRLSREYGGLITYHCCMHYDTHFDSIIKTTGFAGFDPALRTNDFERIEAALVKSRGIWFQMLEPTDLDLIDRLRGKVGMIFSVSGTDRSDAIRRAKDFLRHLRDPRTPRWTSPFVTRWRVSRLLEATDIAHVPAVHLADPLGWFTGADWFTRSADVNSRDRFLVDLRLVAVGRDGLLYAGNRFRVAQPGRWVIRLDHDAPVRLFVDGACVMTESKPAAAGGNRSRTPVTLAAGEHEVVIAIDTDGGTCRGFYFSFEVPEEDRARAGSPRFPVLADPEM